MEDEAYMTAWLTQLLRQQSGVQVTSAEVMLGIIDVVVDGIPYAITITETEG